MCVVGVEALDFGFDIFCFGLGDWHFDCLLLFDFGGADRFEARLVGLEGRHSRHRFSVVLLVVHFVDVKLS